MNARHNIRRNYRKEIDLPMIGFITMFLGLLLIRESWECS